MREFSPQSKLTTDEIPMISRIIGVADAYNAMTSDRPYRDAMPSRVARMRLAQSVGKPIRHLRRRRVRSNLAGAGESYRLAADDEFGVVARAANVREAVTIAAA